MYKNSRIHKIPDGEGRSQSYRDYLNGQYWTWGEYYELFGRHGRPDTSTKISYRAYTNGTHTLKSDKELRRKFRDLLKNDTRNDDCGEGPVCRMGSV